MDLLAKIASRKAETELARREETANNERRRNDIAHKLLIASAVASALSAGASAWAAWSTSIQAKYAQKALTATDLNRGFEKFYDKWSDLCAVIDVTDGYIGFQMQGKSNLKMIVVHSTDLGYSFEKFDRSEQRIKVIRAMNEAVAAQEKLALWLDGPTLDNMQFQSVVSNLILLSRIDTDEHESRHYLAMMRQAGYCQIWKSWFMQWFNQGYSPAPLIDFQNVRIIFNARDGGVLNDDYIQKSRELPWNEIHRHAPP